MQPQFPATSVALTVVAATGVLLALLGLTALFAPARAKAFLLGFAATPMRHHLELAVRIAVGMAFMVASPRLAWPSVFFAFGAVLVGTTTVMALLPHSVHREFARRAVPKVLVGLPAIGLASLAAGIAVAWCAVAASAA